MSTVIRPAEMNTTSARSFDQVKPSEIVIAVQQDGVFSLWATPKKNLVAFLDPAMLEKGTIEFESHGFKPLSSETWGYAGAGIVVMDFDNKQAWSLNEVGKPLSIFPLEAEAEYRYEDPAFRPLVELSEKSELWPYIQMKVAKPTTRAANFFARLMDKETDNTHLFSVSSILHFNATSEDFMNLLTQYDGMVEVPDLGKCVFLSADYIPPGWVQHDRSGQVTGDWILEQLSSLRDRGFPPPNWSSFESPMMQNPMEFGDKIVGKTEIDELMNLGDRLRKLSSAWKNDNETYEAATRSNPNPIQPRLRASEWKNDNETYDAAPRINPNPIYPRLRAPECENDNETYDAAPRINPNPIHQRRRAP